MRIMKASGVPFEQGLLHEADQLQLGFLKVLKGSSMYHEAQKYEILYKGKKSLMRFCLPPGFLMRGYFEAENGGKYGGSVLY